MTITPTVWRSPFRVNVTDQPEPGNAHATATDKQSYSKVVALTGGRFLVAWEDSSTKFAGGLEPRDIVGRIYDAFGNPLSSDISLSGAYADLDQKFQDVAATPSGGFIVAYQTSDATGFLNDGENITVEVFDQNGTRIRVDDFRQSQLGPDDFRPTVIVLADGSYVLVYEEDAGGQHELVGYTVDNTDDIPANTTRSAKFQVLGAASAVNETAADMAVLGSNYVVVYQQDNATSDIKFAIRTLAGAVTPGTAATGTGNETAPVVATLATGGFAIAWIDSAGDGAGNAGIKARIFSNEGTALGAAFTIPTTTAGAQSAPAIAALTDGSFVVAWFDTPRNGVYGQRFSATGVKIGVEFNLGGTSGYSEPSMALLGDGRLVAGLTFAESGPNFNVYAEIFDPRTSVTGTNGDDILTSRLDGAVVSGIGGADTLVGFAGNDTLDGGAGTIISKAVLATTPMLSTAPATCWSTPAASIR